MRFHFPTAVTTRRTNALQVVLLLLSIGSIHANAQTAGEQDVPLLDSRQPIKRNISCGEYQYYRIMLVTDQYLRLVVDQRGVDVSVKLYQPDGKIVAESNRMPGAYGPETIAWVAESSGSYKLEVRSAATEQVGAHYEVKILEERTATSQDRGRIAAQDVFMQAEQLRQSSLEQAIAKYEEARQMWKDIGNPSGEAETLDVLGLIYHLSKGDPVKARQHFEEALKMRRTAGDRRGEAETLNHLARFFESQGERQTALDYYKQSLQSWVDSGDRYGEAWALFNLGQIYLFLKEAPNALDHYNRALRLWRVLGDLSREASTLNGIGDSYFSISDFNNARSFYEQARLKWPARDLTGQASTLFSLSRTYGELKDKNRESEFRKAAERLRSQSRPACTRPPDIQTKSDTVRLAEQAREEARALLLQNTEDAQRKAIEKYEDAVKLFHRAGDYDREVATLFDISSIYRTLDDERNERNTLERSMSVAQDANKPALRAETLQRFAAFYFDHDDPLKAVDYYDRAIQIWRRQRDRRSEAYVLGMAAKIYDNPTDSEKAVRYLEQALALYQDLGDRFREAYTLNDLAAIYLKSGQKRKALGYLRRTLNLRREKGDRAGEAETLKEIAAVLLSIGEKREALEYYYQTLQLYLRIRDGMGQAESLSGLMAYWKDQNRPALAIFYGKQAVNTYQEVRRNIQGLEKETQTSFLKSKEDIYRELADLLISLGRLPEAQQVLDLLKEEEFNNFIRGGKRKSTERVELSPKEEEQYRQYKEKTDRATAISREYDELLAKPAKNPDEIRRFEELTKQIEAEKTEFANYLEFLSKAFITPDQKDAINRHKILRATLIKLGPGAVALYTLVVKDRYRVVLYTPRLEVAGMYSIKAADLNSKINTFRLALQDPKSDPLPLAKELYQILLGPIAKDLEGAKAETLMWFLDGALRYIPIAALHDGNQYVVDRFRNEIFFAEGRDQLADDPAPSWRGLGLGVSSFQKDPNLDPLPAVVEELTGIFRNEDDSNATGGAVPGKIILNEKFTKDAMIKALQSEKKYQVVHVATHFVMQLGKEDSYLVLGNGDKLTVEDVDKLPTIFFGVDLLTLSACDTAHKGTGDEVDGLAGVAQRQGAKAVIASLWAVADASTGRLMQKLYEVRVRNPEPASKAESLQKAQLAFLHKEITSSDPSVKDYSHPYFWAPFILIGNWR